MWGKIFPTCVIEKKLLFYEELYCLKKPFKRQMSKYKNGQSIKTGNWQSSNDKGIIKEVQVKMTHHYF